jgi:hypothetical protein
MQRIIKLPAAHCPGARHALFWDAPNTRCAGEGLFTRKPAVVCFFAAERRQDMTIRSSRIMQTYAVLLSRFLYTMTRQILWLTV